MENLDVFALLDELGKLDAKVALSKARKSQASKELEVFKTDADKVKNALYSIEDKLGEKKKGTFVP